MTCWLAEVGVDDPRTHAPKEDIQINSFGAYDYDLLAFFLAALARNRENENIHAISTNKYGTYKQYVQN